MDITILIPSRQKRSLLQHIKTTKTVDDKIVVLNVNMHQLTEVLNATIDGITSEYIILVDPQCRNISIDLIKEQMPGMFVDEENGVIGFKKSDFKKIDKKCIYHKQYRSLIAHNINHIDHPLEVEPNTIFTYSKISIIIPYMFNGDRWELFELCIRNLHNLIKNDDTIELVIHETGPIRALNDGWIEEFNILYEFTRWDDVFHRGWSLNYAAKHIATGDLFVFMDADLFIDKQWLKSIKKCNTVSVGWSEMVNLNKSGTTKMLSNSIISITKSDIDRVRKPSVFSAAGGINVYPKEVFYRIKGWCEDYYGTYGGEDNSTFLKLQNFGYVMNVVKAKVFHLHHSHTTLKHPRRFIIFNQHKLFDKQKWMQYVDNIKIWGDEKPLIEICDKKLKILWCKIDTSNRVAGHYDDLLSVLTSECHVDTITQSLQGLHPAIFQQKCLSYDIKRSQTVKQHLDINQDYDFIICADIFAFNHEPWNSIKIPKAAMLEDQHSSNNLAQVQDMIRDNWIVLHRYKFKKFHTDLHNYLKCIWFPHSVNVNIFRDYKYKKEYDILQTGAIYKVYETRNFMINKFKDDPRYKIIERPKENTKVQWPTRRDYSKELNKAYMNICCGSVYQYPVMKYFEIPASNSVIFGDWFDELGDLGFERYVSMLPIDKTDINTQVDILLKNKDKLLEIASNGYNLIHERHTNEIRVKELIQIVKDEIDAIINTSSNNTYM